ncbi:MAG: Ig-like domain-containing protein [Ekhidna sp.]
MTIVSDNDTNTDKGKTNDIVSLTFTVDDDLTGLPDVTFRSGGANVNNGITVAANGAHPNYLATYTVSSLDNEGDVTFTINFTDDAGNDGSQVSAVSGTGSSTSVTIDNTAPTVTFTDSMEDPSNTSPVVVTATFDEDVTGLASSDLTVTNGTISSITGTAPTSVYTINVTPNDPLNDSITVQLNSMAVLDDAGNANDASSIYYVDYDNIAPVITSSAIVQGRELSLTAQLDEPGTVYYVVVADGVSITNASDVVNVSGAAASPVASGSVSFTTGGINIVESITLNADRTNYDLYLVSEDNVDTKNLSSVTSADIQSGGVTINTPNVVDVCLEGDFYTIPNVVVTETIATDFNSSSSNRTIVLELPENFVFQDAGNVSVNAGSEVVIVSSANNTAKTTLTITYTVSGEALMDVLTISSLEVQASGTSISSAASLTRTGGNGDIYGINDENAAIPAFAQLTTIAPFNAPTIEIATPSSVTQPYILETAGSILGDTHGDGVIVYNKSQFVSSLVPMTIGSVNASDSVKIYADEALDSLVLKLGNSATYSPNLGNLGLTDTNVGVNTFWITATDGNSCESAATKYGVAIIRFTNSASTTTFSSSDQNGTVFKFTNPSGSSASFSGPALTSFETEDEFEDPQEPAFSAKYLPTTAGAGRDTLKYTLTNEAGQTANYWIATLVNSTDRVFEDSNIGSAGLCADISSFDFEVRDVDNVDFGGTESGTNADFYSIGVFLYEDETRSDSLSFALSDTPSIQVNIPTSKTGWQLDLDSLKSVYLGDENYSIRLDVVMYISDEATGKISELSSELVTVFRNPTVIFQNLTDGNFYCADDELFDIEVEITSETGSITRNIDDNGYVLFKWDGAEYDTVLVSDTTSLPARLRFEDLNINGDSTAYKISYTSAGYTSASCASTVESTFTVYPKPDVRNLTLTSELSNRGDLDMDGSYTFEYCEGDTFDGLSISLNEGDSVAWYRNAELTDRIATSVTNGSSITATNLFGSTTEAQGVEDETFYYVIYENRNGDFDGCASDAVSVNYKAYPTPDAPVLVNSNSSEIGINEFEFNYCVENGEEAVLEDLNVDNDNVLETANEDYYKLYRLDGSDTVLVDAKLDVQTIVISNYLSKQMLADSSEVFFMERVENDRTQNSTISTEQFGGCNSALTMIRINVWNNPDAPDQSQFADNPNLVTDVITYYLCEGEQLPDISIAGPTGINDFLYEWFDADGNLMTVDDNQGDRLVDSDLELAFGAGYRTNPGTYSMTVQLNANVRDDASFTGCTSPTTRVDLVVLPKSDIPVITASSSTDQSIANEQFIYCVDFETGLDGTTMFEATVNYTASAGYSNRIDWYRVNAAGDPVGNLNAAATGASITATDLGIDGLGAGSSVSQILHYGIVHTSDLVDGYEEFGGCISTTKYIEIIVSPIPDPQFGFDGIVENEVTTFTFFDQNNTEIGTDGLVFSITDSDGVDVLDEPYMASDLTPFNYTFVSDGVYTATMTITTETGCTSSRERTFRILNKEVIERVTTYNFNDNNGGWFTEFQSIDGLSGSVGTPDNNSSWEYGIPSPNNELINIDDENEDEETGGGAWVTNLDGNYLRSEESFLYSPGYDLTRLQNHAVRFSTFKNLDGSKDGVVFQFSVDNGFSWITLGDFNANNEATGVEWYDARNISATPGDNKPDVNQETTNYNPNRVGWSDSDENPSWKTSIHPLNFPDGSDLSNVRFRFALNAIDAEKSKEGFGFDNFTLYELGKTVLIEQFSSSVSENSKAFQESIVAEINRNDVMFINYMTDFASAEGRDILNERNAGGPAARAEYYEVNAKNQTVIDGDVFKIPESGTIDWKISDINLKELATVKFDIENLVVNSTTDNTINASVDFIPSYTDSDANLSFFFAVVETSVSVQAILDDTGMMSLGSYNDNDSILNVLRVLNPDPAGYNYSGEITEETDPFSFSMNWEVTNVYDVNKLRIIAFVQSNENISEEDPENEEYTGRVRKEILQAAYVDVPGLGLENALGLGELSNFSIYPNPGDEEVTVEFDEVTKTEGEWVVFDQAGREVLKGTAGIGTKQLTIETKEIPSGIYLFHMYGEDNSRYAKRLIIVH